MFNISQVLLFPFEVTNFSYGAFNYYFYALIFSPLLLVIDLFKLCFVYLFFCLFCFEIIHFLFQFFLNCQNSGGKIVSYFFALYVDVFILKAL